MSLAVLANHMASKGRHGDDMLVHMSKDEVAALQRLAEQHGMTLTINPETGLPEAFSLKSLLGVVAPIALNFLFPGAGAALGTTLGIGEAAGGALLAGGVSALATGSLEKGLMTGLMSYGLSGLGGNLAKAADIQAQVPVAKAAEAGAIVPPEVAAQEAARQAQEEGFRFRELSAQKALPETPYTTSGLEAAKANIIGGAQQYGVPSAALTTPDISAAIPVGTTLPADTQAMQDAFARSEILGRNAAAQNVANMSVADKMKLATSPGFLKDNWKNLAMVGVPAALMVGSQPSLKGVPTGTDPSKVYFPRFAFDPQTRTMTRMPGFTLADYRAGLLSGTGPSLTAAEGGIVALADGGVAFEAGNTPSYQRTSTSPGMLDFAQKSEPVVRMADGGVAHYAGSDGSYVTDLSAADRAAAEAAMFKGSASAPVVAAPVVAAPVVAAPVAPPPAAGLSSLVPPATVAAAIPAPAPAPAIPSAEQLGTVTNIYRNVLGRDPDAEGLQYWAGRLAGGESLADTYKALQGSAKSVLASEGIAAPTTLATPLSLAQATAPMQVPTGYSAPSTYNTTMADEWAQNVLGRGLTAADTQQDWYKNLNTLNKTADVDKAYSDFLQANSVKAKDAPNWFEASRLGALVKNKVIPPTPKVTTGFDLTAGVGTTTSPIAPVIPGAGPVPTMNDVVDAYTKGGGSLGYIPYAPKTMAELEAKYPLSGASKAAYDYLTGKAGATYPAIQNVPGGIAQPYWKAAGMALPVYGKDVKGPTTTDTTTVGTPTGSYTGLTADDKTAIQNALGTAKSSKDYGPLNALLKSYKLTEADLMAAFPGMKPEDINPYKQYLKFYEPPAVERESLGASGGIMNLAHGGEIPLGVLGAAAQGGQFDLGDYSDGGRLLRGPGDGVSDSIPASIGNKRPARLADGEFVVPARIVSELGNGSTDAGARKLYAMMDRIQARRGKTTGKGRVAVDSRADKSLPA